MLRYLVVWLPGFRLERCGYGLRERVLLHDRHRGTLRVVAMTPSLRSEGIVEGMRVADAKARAPDALLEPLDADGEHADREALLSMFAQITSRVHPLASDAVALEISREGIGADRVEVCVQSARSIATSCGHRCRLVVADDPLAARALAPHSESDVVVPQGESARWLARLPLSALQPSVGLVRAWSVIGLRSVGDLAALDAASVADRYGREGRYLWGVARGQPNRLEGLLWSHEEGGPCVVWSELGGATTTRQLLFVLPGLLRVLMEKLRSRGHAVVCVRLTLDLEEGSPEHWDVRVGRPTQRSETLEVLLSRRLEDVQLSAPVARIGLEVLAHEAARDLQPGLSQRAERASELPDLLARLYDRLGVEACFVPEPMERWCPEASWRPRVFGDAIASVTAARPDPAAPFRRWEMQAPRGRPSRLLSRPKAVRVRLERGKLVSIWMDTQRLEVVASRGPERIEGRWWSSIAPVSRDYWEIQVANRWAWVFRTPSCLGLSIEPDGDWYLHGWFD